MQKKNNEKGITLLILVITVMVLILITVPMAMNTSEVSELQKYTYFKNDIDRMRESIETAYINSNDISTIGDKYTGDLAFLDLEQNGKIVKNPNDNANYYIINLSKLNSYIDAQIELTYGKGNKGEANTDDVYIINEQTRTIYYVKGIMYKNMLYYRLQEDFTELTNVYVISYDANGGTGDTEMETVTVANSTITLKTAPTKNGSTFLGWKEAGTDNIYNTGDTYTVNKSTKFIAQWKVLLSEITGNETSNTDTGDKDGNRIVVPAGFKVVNPESTVDEGIVIEDVNGNNADTVGNQFVWIPCTLDGAGGTLKYDRYAFTRESPTWDYRQSLVLGTNGEYEKDTDGSYKIVRADNTSYYYHEAMPEQERASIEKYGGFYLR